MILIDATPDMYWMWLGARLLNRVKSWVLTITIKTSASAPILIVPSVIPDENIILHMERDDLFHW